MSPPRALRRRITIAYLLLAVSASALFGVIAMLAVEGIEERLVDQRLRLTAAWASPRHAAGLPIEMPAGVIFYHGDAIPLSLRGLSPGIQEKSVDGEDMQLLVGRDQAGDYVVVDRDSDYEKIEAVVYSIVATGFVVLMLLAVFLGRYMARRVVTPMAELAQAVQLRTAPATLPLLDREDELGVLARAFSERTIELDRFLARERFFTGDVSHELRTPLTVIIGAAEILCSRSAQTPDLQATANRMLRAARDAAERVNVLLLLARSPQLIDAPSVSVASVVKDEIERHRHLLAARPVTLTLDVEEDFVVAARAELLATAIGNLVRNACMYTAQGSVLVRVGRRRVTVEDTGPGIPDSVRAKLMDEPDLLQRDELAGTGIGLALTRRICEHLSARLTVAGGRVGGTSFSIGFPGA